MAAHEDAPRSVSEMLERCGGVRARAGVLPAVAALVVAAGVLLWAAPAASAVPSPGSLVFIKRGNVWLTSPDGSRQRQVTRGGGYSSPSQSDSGIIVALRRKALVRLTRRGRRIGRPVPLIGTNATSSGNLTVQAGPADLRVSPDGELAAYWIGVMHQTCSPVTYYCDYRLQDQTVITHTDRFTSPQVFGITRDYREPSWATDRLLLVFNYGLADTVAIDRAGDGDADLFGWFSDAQGAQLGKGQAAAHADVLALLAGSQRDSAWQETIRLYAFPPPPDPPVPVCQIAGVPGGFTNPSWRPDGRALAWQQQDGVHVAPVPALAAPAVECTSIRDRRIARGSEPFWGPKPVRRRDGLRRG